VTFSNEVEQIPDGDKTSVNRTCCNSSGKIISACSLANIDTRCAPTTAKSDPVKFLIHEF